MKTQFNDLTSSFQQWVLDEPRNLLSSAIARVILGFAILIHLMSSFTDRQIIWGIGAWWQKPETSRRGWWDPFSLIFSQTNSTLFDVVYILMILVTIVFIIGWRTRWVTPVLAVLWIGLSSSSTVFSNGGDVLIRLTLFFFVFMRISDRLSVDALRSKRSGAPRKHIIPKAAASILHNSGLLICQFQIVLVYAASSILKFQGAEWPNGTALYYALSLDQFMLFPAFNELIWQITPVIYLATWIAFAFQACFPVFILWRPTRNLAVVVLTGMHLGIAVLLGLWPFSLAMIALDMLFISDRSWIRVRQFKGKVLHKIQLLKTGGGTNMKVASEMH